MSTEVLAAGGERIPPTVRDAVLARAAGLSGAARDVLEAVAVVPQRTEVWLLEALVQRALDGLDECLESGMLRGEADGVAFRHELARLAIEESLAPHRAVVLHRRALAALAQPAIGSPDLVRLAHHAEAAGDTAPCSATPRRRQSMPRRLVRTARLCTSTGARCGSRRDSRPSGGRSCWSGSPTRGF